LIELAVVFALVLLNGVFALSELALVSARRPRLRALAEAGRPGARAALAVAEDPGRFLSTVQVGITLVGVLAGAFSGSALGGRVAAWLIGLGMPAAIAEPVGFGAIIALVTYLCSRQSPQHAPHEVRQARQGVQREPSAEGQQDQAADHHPDEAHGCGPLLSRGT
jgi:Mg2+/Co2+ transporter CorB